MAFKRGSFKFLVIVYFIFQLYESSVTILAVEYNQFNVLDILLEHGADINEVDEEQGSILQTLFRTSRSSSVEEILEWTAYLLKRVGIRTHYCRVLPNFVHIDMVFVGKGQQGMTGKPGPFLISVKR